jgi:hypothetical protein
MTIRCGPTGPAWGARHRVGSLRPDDRECDLAHHAARQLPPLPLDAEPAGQDRRQTPPCQAVTTTHCVETTPTPTSTTTAPVWVWDWTHATR